MTKITAVLPERLQNALEERARAEDRSAASVVRLALKEYLARGEKDEPDYRPEATYEQ